MLIEFSSCVSSSFILSEFLANTPFYNFIFRISFENFSDFDIMS